jgi:hypothetical protein
MNILAYVVMKTDRAKNHLDMLNREVDAFLKEACTITAKEDIENSLYIRRTQFNAMNPVMGMLLGEFLYCLRSGLDQMAWQLALPSARNDSRKAGLICFPIFAEVKTSDDRKNLRKTLDLFPDEVARGIDALQPYKGPGSPKEHALWQLNKLCNIDKHCIIPINSRAKPIFVPHTDPPAIVRKLDDEDAVEVIVPLADKNKFYFDPNAPAEIEFGEWDSDLVIPRHALSDIYGFITRTVLPKFSRFDGPIIDRTTHRYSDPKTLYWP